MTRESVQFEIEDDVQLNGDRWPSPSTGPGTSTGKPVVLLHSGVCDRRGWYTVADQLAEAEGVGPIVAYDRRAFGETPVSARPFHHLDDLIAVLDQSFDQPAWLVGSSMGGGLALDTALQHPDRVAGLVLLAPAISGAPRSELDPGTQRLSDLMDVADAVGDAGEVNRLETTLWLDGPAGPEGRVQGAARDLALAMNAIVLANETAEHTGASEIEVWPVLEKLQLPVTVAWGDLDLPNLIELCGTLADRLPLSRSLILPGTAHLPYLDRPDLVVPVIREAVLSAG
jgi:pimeloyl-ACP methyl ester carboxylesterase